MSPSVEVFKLCRMLPGGMEEHSRAPQCPKSPAPRGRPPQTRPCWRRCPFCSLSSRLRRIPGPSKRRRKMLKLVAWLSALCPMALKPEMPVGSCPARPSMSGLHHPQNPSVHRHKGGGPWSCPRGADPRELHTSRLGHVPASLAPAKLPHGQPRARPFQHPEGQRAEKPLILCWSLHLASVTSSGSEFHRLIVHMSLCSGAEILTFPLLGQRAPSRGSRAPRTSTATATANAGMTLATNEQLQTHTYLWIYSSCN
ncbi:uncharacterized protein [Emydura macquarii macquarii]|uniref:uncharacterized protein isoform X2 n=1 Tax=Emydura macquarii macquarii TaxID=1129001 RepID=UPI00352A22C5